MVKVAKRKKKLIKNPRAARKPSKNGQAKAKTAGQSDKFAPNQEPLKGMEDVDERIEALDEECQRYFAAHDRVLSGREQKEESLGKVGILLKEHGLDCYILNGKKFYIEPSKSTVKVKKVTQQ